MQGNHTDCTTSSNGDEVLIQSTPVIGTEVGELILDCKNIMCDPTVAIFRDISDLGVLQLVVNHVDDEEAAPITTKSDGGLHVSKGLRALDIAFYLDVPQSLWPVTILNRYEHRCVLTKKSSQCWTWMKLR